MSKKPNLSKIIREEFNTHEILTTTELYTIISEKIDFDVSKRNLQHSIRSRLNTMVNKGSIIWVSPKTYTKLKKSN